MKLTTNFSLPIRKIMLATCMVSMSGSMAGLSVTYLLAQGRSELINKSSNLKANVIAFKEISDSMHADNKQTLSQPDIDNTRRRIEAINNLTPVKSITVTQLLSTIENLLPQGVSVGRLNYSSIDGQLHLVAETADADLIYTFMKRLEQSPIFVAPEMQQRPIQDTQTDGMTQYEIHVVARNS